MKLIKIPQVSYFVNHFQIYCQNSRRWIWNPCKTFHSLKCCPRIKFWPGNVSDKICHSQFWGLLTRISSFLSKRTKSFSMLVNFIFTFLVTLYKDRHSDKLKQLLELQRRLLPSLIINLLWHNVSLVINLGRNKPRQYVIYSEETQGWFSSVDLSSMLLAWTKPTFCSGHCLIEQATWEFTVANTDVLWLANISSIEILPLMTVFTCQFFTGSLNKKSF